MQTSILPVSGAPGASPHALWHFWTARGQVEDGCGHHVGGLHGVTAVEAAFAAGAAGAGARAPSASGTPWSSSTAAADAGGICAAGVAG